jgi:hypothetical protein
MQVRVTVSPAPFTSDLTILIESDIAFNAVLRLTDNNKKLVRMIGSPLHKGENKIFIKNLSRYVIGIYYLEVKLLNGKLVETIEITKE